jgi:mannose-6-phosphate isomerase-like protein (cupin superfamily)
MDGIVRGRLRDPAEAPATGETTEVLAAAGAAVVEQILSGRLDAAVDYLGTVDEWVVVVAGAAELEVAGTPVVLTPGEWLLLPAGTPHRLTATRPGTSWITVTAPVAPARPTGPGG